MACVSAIRVGRPQTVPSDLLSMARFSKTVLFCAITAGLDLHVRIARAKRIARTTENVSMAFVSAIGAGQGNNALSKHATMTALTMGCASMESANVNLGTKGLLVAH